MDVRYREICAGQDGLGGTLYYSGLGLDRVGGRRTDSEWVAGLLTSPSTQVIPLWRDHCLVRDDTPIRLPLAEARGILDAADDQVLLGLDGEAAVFAADVSRVDRSNAVELATADTVLEVRAMVPTITPDEAGLLAYARGILHWNRNQRFCGACGGPAVPSNGGHLRTCQDCGKLLFPRIEPAVIVLVELPGTPRRCLLGRHAGSGPDRFSTLAGFVEIGESLEDTVRREVAEEAGVTVGTITYQGSQSWPFPSGMMIGFRAEAVSDWIDVDNVEVVEARWFTAAELRSRITDSAVGGPYRVDSIDKVLIDQWLADVE
ncbi:NAD(+) diphosphatase [Streptomyces sp. NPDC059849]|uniref:NAD(+) diphosphatase n=1 Tax=Streptomyces sp. NPDC059849 TaxID=3346969 RepID=UPI003651111C